MLFSGKSRISNWLENVCKWNRPSRSSIIDRASVIVMECIKNLYRICRLLSTGSRLKVKKIVLSGKEVRKNRLLTRWDAFPSGSIKGGVAVVYSGIREPEGHGFIFSADPHFPALGQAAKEYFLGEHVADLFHNQSPERPGSVSRFVSMTG